MHSGEHIGPQASFRAQGSGMLVLALLLVGSAPASRATSVGDTYDQVVAERGTPRSEMSLGATRVLEYPDATIKIRDGKVVLVKGGSASSAPAQSSVLDLSRVGSDPKVTLSFVAPPGWKIQWGRDPQLVMVVDPAKRGMIQVVRFTNPEIVSATSEQIFAPDSIQALAETLGAKAGTGSKLQVKRIQNDWWDGAYFEIYLTKMGVKMLTKNWLMKMGPNLVAFQCAYILPDLLDEVHRQSRISELDAIFETALKSVTDNRAAAGTEGSHP